MLSNSQIGQDLFADHFVPRPGYFLDIGCHDPVKINNTYRLEQRGWTGLMLDIFQEYIDRCHAKRKAKALQFDMKSDDIRQMLREQSVPMMIDYISFDIDDATSESFERFPWDTYRFRVMTFEHDAKRIGEKGIRLRDRSREVLKYFGYILLCGDVDGGEDWWINPSQVIITTEDWQLESEGRGWKDIIFTKDAHI